MSRRKQSKPQHVEFPDNKTALLSNNTRASDNSVVTLSEGEQVKESAASFANSTDCSSINTSVVDCETENNSSRTKVAGNQKLETDFKNSEGGKSSCSSTNSVGEKMSSHFSSEDIGDHKDFSPESLARGHGQFPPSHRSLLFPRYNGTFTTQKRDDWSGQDKTNYSGDQESSMVAGSEETHNQDKESTAGDLDTSSDQVRPRQTSEQSVEMHSCDRCSKKFEILLDYIRHRDCECPVNSPGDDMIPEQPTENNPNGCNNVTGNNPGYVISGNVIMASEEDLMNDRRRTTDDEDRELNIDEDRCMDESSRTSNLQEENDNVQNAREIDSSRIDSQEYNDERSVTPDSIVESEGNSEKIEEPFISNEDSGHRIVHGDDRESRDKGAEIDETEKLRKEIMAAEAMAHAIQNMTAFASQNGNPERPDIGAIKYQVRMIQQQQAYQVQMLNFLQWQLALSSGNQQAAVAAAGNRPLHNGFPVNPASAMQPSFMPGGPGIPGSSFMPQMMAAMAMNNFQSPDSSGMAELAKARLMMGMQQASVENNRGFRGLFPSSVNENDEGHRNEQEQRYQLKIANEENVDSKFDEGHRKDDSNAPPKSDSGYCGDDRGFSNGQIADDASSSHGSQEDGELRDNALKSTAEEHRHRCRFCHKIFGSDSALQIHIRSHTGERPFKCNICGNRFTTKGNLKVHFTRHKSKYPHIPMNGQPVPEYLDHVPTSNGVPYGMSILPEKAALERPRLHGNPSIHLSPQQAAILSQRESVGSSFPGLFPPQFSALNGKSESDLHHGERPDGDVGNGVGAADVATAIHAQLLQRRRSELLESHWSNEEAKKAEVLDHNDNKNPMSLLQAAMMPFLPGIAARQQLENIPPHLRYLLPHQLNALQNQAVSNNSDLNNNVNNMEIRLPTLHRTTSPHMNNSVKQEYQNPDKMTSSRPQASSSETTKLQRLVENIDRGRKLEKNECHICHRILSCQSALKLHYRTHTGERPYKCDLCSRAFTTRGNLRTHYSSVHRQQMRPLPPSNSRSSNSETFSCGMCPARFRDPMEFQRHMQVHAAVQAQRQKSFVMGIQSDQRTASPLNPMEELTPQENMDVDNSSARDENASLDSQKQTKSQTEDMDKDDDRRSSISHSDNEERRSEPKISVSDEIQQPIPTTNDDECSKKSSSPSVPNPLDSLAALSNLNHRPDGSEHTGSMLDHQLAALSRARAGRLTVCEICEKPFSCQSALEIHIRTHTKERPFICQICQRAFTTKGNLKQHLLTHNITDIPEQMLIPVSSPKRSNSTSTSPSSSPQPNDSHDSSAVKRGSESSDMSEPPLKRTYPRHWCHICQKQFSSASSLQIHNRTHTGEKPFACNVCGRAFTTKGNLKVHMGTHVWGAGGSRRGRRISMDNPLISPWMKNMTRAQPTQPAMPMPTPGPVPDPSTAAALYQQYAALARGILSAKQDAASRFMMPIANGHNGNAASSPVSSNGSPRPPNELGSPQNRVNGTNNPAVNAATEWFLKAYQRTQEQVN